MGIGVAIAGVAISGANAISQKRSQDKQQALSTKASLFTKEGNRINAASETVANKLSRRETAKAERLNRARLINSSRASGTTGSSGELGALSAISASFGASVARQRADIKAAKRLTKINNKLGRLQDRATTEANRAKTNAALFSFAGTALNTLDSAGVFDPSPTTPAKSL